ncbi:MAG: heme o synthase [Acidobacteriota bacterium]
MNRTTQSVAAQQVFPLAAGADYLMLVKPRVVAMIVLTTLSGFLMGATGSIDYVLLLHTLLATALVGAGTLALNQYMERDIDARMLRTRQRPLPDGRMRAIEALVFGGFLTIVGLLYLTLIASPLAGLVTAMTVIGYLFVYTPLKTRTALCTVLGAFPGALPPVTGWAAATGGLGPGAIVLFGILFFWQLPHSLAIAQLYREDYNRAGIRLLPTVDPASASTRRQIALNCMALFSVGLLPAVLGMAGWFYLAAALLLGGWMLAAGAVLTADVTRERARRLLLVSYLYVPVVFIAMAADKIGS